MNIAHNGDYQSIRDSAVHINKEQLQSLSGAAGIPIQSLAELQSMQPSFIVAASELESFSRINGDLPPRGLVVTTQPVRLMSKVSLPGNGTG